MLLHSAMLIAAGTAVALAAPDGDPRVDRDRVVAPAPMTTPVAATSPVADARARPETRYCVVRQPTGSLLVKRTCRTREQWIASDEFDPLTAID